MKGGWVYIVTNRAFGTLYVGVTNDIERRAYEHRQALGSTFTAKYRVGRLIFAEYHDDIRDAIAREGFALHAVPFVRGSLSPIAAFATIRALRRVQRGLAPDIVHRVALQAIEIGRAHV